MSRESVKMVIGKGEGPAPFTLLDEPRGGEEEEERLSRSSESSILIHIEERESLDKECLLGGK